MRVCAGCANRNEATANVDPENEDRLQKAIEALTRDKTILMIAHRLKTVRGADQILVLDGGKIVQRGTHDELIQEDGIYADFVGSKKETAGWKLEKREKSAERCDFSALFWSEDSYGGAPVRK